MQGFQISVIENPIGSYRNNPLFEFFTSSRVWLKVVRGFSVAKAQLQAKVLSKLVRELSIQISQQFSAWNNFPIGRVRFWEMAAPVDLSVRPNQIWDICISFDNVQGSWFVTDEITMIQQNWKIVFYKMYSARLNRLQNSKLP